MVATFLQMGRSAHLARWLHQARQRTLEKRVREATDMKEIAGLQRRLDAQQSQAAVVEQAAARFRNRARELAQFARSGLTMEDFRRMGVHDVVDVEQFNAEVAKVQKEVAASATPASPPTSPPEAAPPGPVSERIPRPPMRLASSARGRAAAVGPAAEPAPTTAAAPAAKKAAAPAAKKAAAPAAKKAAAPAAKKAAAPAAPPSAPVAAHDAAKERPGHAAETAHKKKPSRKKPPRHKG